MRTQYLLLSLISFAAFAADPAAPPGGNQVPPPAVPPKRSAADLEKLVAPIALHPDPLIATILPASVYPLEIVQAARFVADTNNLDKLDEQPWDDNVKAVARVPGVIKQMNGDLTWTMELGEAFLAQDKDVMDAMQSLRTKAQQIGTLKTTPQQVVVVTNLVVEKTVEQKVVVVTNTIVQIQPSNPQVVYVPTYNPAVVYYPPPPAYVGPPPVVTFAAGVAVGAIIANNCDWHHGGCYRGDVNIDIDRNVNVNNNVNRSANVNNNANRTANFNNSGARASSTGARQKWQPDQSRLNKSGSPSTATASKQARGWDSGGAGARPSTDASLSSRSATSASASRPSTPQSKASPSSSRGSSSPSAFSGASSGSRGSSASSRGSSSRFGSSGRSGGGGRSFGGR
jgi:hypothetical protein